MVTNSFGILEKSNKLVLDWSFKDWKKGHIKHQTPLLTFWAFTISFILNLNDSFSFNETGLYCSNDLLWSLFQEHGLSVQDNLSNLSTSNLWIHAKFLINQSDT